MNNKLSFVNPENLFDVFNSIKAKSNINPPISERIKLNNNKRYKNFYQSKMLTIGPRRKAKIIKGNLLVCLI